MAHESDPRKLYCPYQDISERPKSKYPCLFYDERTKEDDLIDKINSVGSVNPVTPEEVRTLCIKT